MSALKAPETLDREPRRPPLDDSDDLRQHRPFVIFWLARVCSTVALQIQSVAVAWQIYDLTQRPLDLGLVGLSQFAPAFLLILFAGHAADRYDRRAVLRMCQGAQGAAVLLLAVATGTGAITRELIFAAVFVIGAARAFEGPAQQSLLPNVVPEALFARAAAGSSSANQFATIAGPALGGILYDVSPVATYGLCATLLLLAAVFVTFARGKPARFLREPFSFRTLFVGFGFIWRQPVVLGAISLDLFAVLLGGAVALLPIYARDILQVDSWGLGLLRASPALGALATTLVLVRWPLRRRVGRTLFLMVAIYGVATLGFAFSTTLLAAMAALVVLGAADVVSVVIRQTLVQLETPDAMRGRVSAVSSLFTGTSNQLGEFRAGVMANWLGAVPAVAIGAVGTLLIVAAGLRAFPQLLAADRMDARRTREAAESSAPATGAETM